MKLILIHGRDQQRKDPVELKKAWLEALDTGLTRAGLRLPDGVEVIFPYYGDELDRLAREIDAPLVEAIATRGAAIDSTEENFRGRLLLEIAQGAGVSQTAIEAHYPEGPQERGLLNWKWVHAIAKAIDHSCLRAGAIDAFTRDVSVYLTYPAVRRRIDKLVRDLCPVGPCVVVGHSLGSVVGYNVLHQLKPESPVTRYITVGSPLGLQAIMDRLAHPLAMPRTTATWFNAFDPRDIVALHPLTADRFPVIPAIDNKGDVANHTDNRHGIAGYLDDPVVAGRIVEALASSP